jgi:hypothetical protein
VVVDSHQLVPLIYLVVGIQIYKKQHFDRKVRPGSSARIVSVAVANTNYFAYFVTDIHCGIYVYNA